MALRVLSLVLLAVCANAITIKLDELDFVDLQSEDYVPIEGAAKELLDFSHLHLEGKSTQEYVDDELFQKAVAGADPRVAEAKMKEVVDRVVQDYCTESLEIDNFGSYHVKSDEFPVFNFDVLLRNVVIQGLENLRIENFSFNILTQRVTARVVIPRLRVTGEFDGIGSFAKVINLIRNGGKIRFIADDIVTDVNLRLSVSIFGSTTLREFDMNISIGRTFIYIDGLISNGYINFAANWVLQRVKRYVIENQMERISSVLSDIIFRVVNYFAEQFNIIDILFPR